MVKKIENIIKGWYYKFRGINFELMDQRMKQCRECSEILYLTKNVTECNVCGCILSAKARVEDEKCPLNKW
jgi:rRNA maturation endonuclease Nob1